MGNGSACQYQEPEIGDFRCFCSQVRQLPATILHQVGSKWVKVGPHRADPPKFSREGAGELRDYHASVS